VEEVASNAIDGIIDNLLETLQTPATDLRKSPVVLTPARRESPVGQRPL
jgi:hypothetical protein